MANEIRDNIERHRFELEVDGHVAFVAYKQTQNVVTLIHTEVPKELGGRGIGSILAKGVLDLLRADGKKAIVECPFIAAFVRKHDEYLDLLAEPLAPPERSQ